MCTFQTCTLFSARCLALATSCLPSMPFFPPPLDCFLTKRIKVGKHGPQEGSSNAEMSRRTTCTFERCTLSPLEISQMSQGCRYNLPHNDPVTPVLPPPVTMRAPYLTGVSQVDSQAKTFTPQLPRGVAATLSRDALHCATKKQESLHNLCMHTLDFEIRFGPSSRSRSDHLPHSRRSKQLPNHTNCSCSRSGPFWGHRHQIQWSNCL